MVAQQPPVPDEVYRHYKGDTYVVIGMGTIEDTREPAVVYHPADQPLDMSRLEIRRLRGPKGWLTPHDQEVIGNVVTKTRFTKI